VGDLDLWYLFVDEWRNGLRVKTSRWLWTWLDLQERDRRESEVGQQMATILVNLAAAQSDIGSPIPLQIALAFRRNDLDPKNPSLLSTDFPMFVTIRDVEFIDPTVRRRHAVQRSHGSSSLFGSRQINKAVTLSRGWDLGIAVHRQHSLADGLQVETLEQVLHLSIDKRLAGDVGQSAHEQSPAFFVRFGPVLACFFPFVPVEDGGFGGRRVEIERLPFAVLHSSFGSMGFAAVALACVVSDPDRAATDGLFLELLDHSFGAFYAGEIDEAVGWVSA
jgi:hypothetical protein